MLCAPSCPSQAGRSEVLERVDKLSSQTFTRFESGRKSKLSSEILLRVCEAEGVGESEVFWSLWTTYGA